MVIARTKLMIHDDLFRPVPRLFVEYHGANVDELYDEIPKLVHAVFRVPVHNIQESKFSWTKGDPEKFKVIWEVSKDIDKFSYYYLQIVFEGQISKGKGHAKLSMEASLRTEYPQDTYFQRSLIYELLRMTWHSTFYTSKREEYIREGRRLMTQLAEKLKGLRERLNLSS